MVTPALFGAAVTSRRQQNVPIPPTTPQCVVFPENSDFVDYRFYSPALTGGRATLEEVRQALRQIHNATTSSRSMIKCNACCVLFMVIITFFFMLVMYSQKNEDGVAACALAAVFEVLVCVTIQFCLKCKLESDCQEAVRRLNKTFLPKGLRWHMPKHFPKWIELHIGVPVNQQIFVRSVYSKPYLPPPMMHQGVDTEAQNHISGPL